MSVHPTPGLQAGKALAEGENFTGLYHAVFRRALYLLGDRHQAEDAAQETLLRYISRRPAGLTSPVAWLVTVCTRLCYDWMRQRRRRPAEPLEAATGLHDPGPAPDQAAETREELHRARQALESLDARDRMILLLRHSGSSYRDIATQVGCAENSVGQLLHRAERRFRAAYELLDTHPPRRG